LAREETEIKSTISRQIDEHESHENESSEPPLKKRKLGCWLKAAMKEQESTSTKSPEELMRLSVTVKSLNQMQTLIL